MQELVWIVEPIKVWLHGGTLQEIIHTRGFMSLMAGAALLIPSSVIMLGIGLDDWNETPLARHLGFGPSVGDEDWAERARDIDKDGAPDF